LIVIKNLPQVTTIPRWKLFASQKCFAGRHGGCKGEGHDNELSEREVWTPNWLLNMDVVDKRRVVLLALLLIT
jgi:hypothetical protein